MALTKHQKEIVAFATKSFEKAANVTIREDGLETNGNQNIGFKDVGVGECYWVSDVKDRIKTNFSLTKYDDGRLREVNLQFKPEAEEIPRIRITFDAGLHATVDTLVMDFRRAKNFIANVKQQAARFKYEPAITVHDALVRNFPKESRYLRYTGVQATYAGKFHNKYSGIYLTVPKLGLCGPQFIELKKITHDAEKTLEKFIGD